MSISGLFARLGAPIEQVRRSSGGVRSDGTVILRVWQDETGRINENRSVQITNHGYL